MRSHYCGQVNESLIGQEDRRRRLGASPARSRRRDLRRPARPRRACCRSFSIRTRKDVFAERRAAARRVLRAHPRPGACASGGHRECQSRLGPGRGAGARARDPEPLRDAAVPSRRSDERGAAPQVSLPRSASRRDAEAPAAASPGDARDAHLARRATASSTSKRRCSPRRRRKARATISCRAARIPVSSSRCRSRRRSSSSC